MPTLSKGVKAGLAAVVCGIGICALAKRLKSSLQPSKLKQNVDVSQFPGINMYAFFERRYLKSLYTEVADEIIETKQFHRILDIATGPGYLPIQLALHDGAISITGMDESPDMLRVAGANARAEHVDKSIEFVTGEVSNLPFPGQHFDLIVSVNALHDWAEPLVVLDEAYHVLEPGGEFWIYDYQSESSSEIWESVSHSLPAHLKLPFAIGPMAAWKAAYSENAIAAFAAQTHFENVIIEQRTFTLYENRMSVFHCIKLRKPVQVRTKE